MRALSYHGPGQKAWETVADPEITHDLDAEQVNEAFRDAAAAGPLSGLLTYSTDPLVKVFGWYDNEWGYTNRLVDLAAFVGGQL